MSGPAGNALTVRALDARLVRVPMRRPLHTGGGRITDAPLMLLDLHTEEGITGRAYLFCYLDGVGHAAVAVAESVREPLVGSSAAPAEVGQVLAARMRLVGVRGVVAGVLATIDVACWDAVAIAAGLPLVRLLGADPRPVPAYNSNGLGLVEPGAAAREAVELAAEGFGAVKMRLGRRDPADDLAAVRAVRRELGDDVVVMADFNQALTGADAVRRCRELDDVGLAWLEEPIRHDDFRGAAALAQELRTPVQLGENFAGPRAMAAAIEAGARDLVMPDLDRIGGVTGWRDAAALADVAGIPMSSHLYPETSAHLLAATPTAHWLEHVDWAAPVLDSPTTVAGGTVTAPDRPGTGVTWDEAAVARLRIG